MTDNKNGYPPTIYEASLIVERSVSTLWKWIREDKIKSVNIGGRVYITREEINTYFKGKQDEKPKRNTRQTKRKSR